MIGLREAGPVEGGEEGDWICTGLIWGGLRRAGLREAGLVGEGEDGD